MSSPSDFSILDEFDAHLPVQELLALLSNPAARYTVYYLREEPSCSLDHLADVITGWTNADSEGIATKTDRDLMRIQLYHSYLPALDALGVVHFNAENREVQLAGPTPTLEAFLDWVSQFERSIGDTDAG